MHILYFDQIHLLYYSLSSSLPPLEKFSMGFIILFSLHPNEELQSYSTSIPLYSLLSSALILQYDLAIPPDAYIQRNINLHSIEMLAQPWYSHTIHNGYTMGQPRYLSTDEWINEIEYIYTIDYYSVI
jgi:hypothetical protein